VDANWLRYWTSTPTFNSCTYCGWYYHDANPTEDAFLACVNYDGGNADIRVRANTGNVQGWASFSYTYTSTLQAMTTGNWYFWALTIDGATMHTWCVDATTDISGSGLAVGSNWGGIDGMSGYNARVRAWSEVLTVAEINAEKASATVVHSGSVLNAPMTATNDIGSFSIEGTLYTGP
jgi:hypothetical protein